MNASVHFFVNQLWTTAASNLAVAALLALIAWSAGCWLRRPALTHALWLLVFLKLLTPPIFPVTIWRTPAGVDVAERAVPQPLPALRPASESMPEPASDGAAAADDLGVSELAGGLNTGVDSPPDEAVVAEAPPLRHGEPEPNETAPVAEDDANVRYVSNVPVGSSTLEMSSTVGVALWLAGSALWLLIAVRRLLGFQKLLRHAGPAPAEIHATAEKLANRIGVRCPRLVVMPGTISPLVWCALGRPRLVIPAGLVERLDERQRETLLAHELAHLRRRDHWVRWLELAVMAVYWWCPLAWWARRHLQQAEEECCDAWVVWALPEAARSYADALLETVDFLSGARPALPVAASGLGRLHLLKRRLTMIMRGTTPRAMSAGGLAVVIGMGAALLPLMPTWAQEPPPDQGGPAVTQPVTQPVAAQPAPEEGVFDEGGQPDPTDPLPRGGKARKKPRPGPDDLREMQRQLEAVQREIAELHNHMTQKRREFEEQLQREFQKAIGEKQLRMKQLSERLARETRDDGGRNRSPLLTVPLPAAPGGARPGAGPGYPGQRPELERRIDDLERKLDMVLRQLERRQSDSTQPYNTPAPRAVQPPPRPRQPVPPLPPAPPAPTRQPRAVPPGAAPQQLPQGAVPGATTRNAAPPVGAEPSTPGRIPALAVPERQPAQNVPGNPLSTTPAPSATP